MYKTEIIVIDYHDLELEVSGTFTEGEKGDYFNPDFPPTFDAQFIHLMCNDVDIYGILSPSAITEIETQIINEILNQ